MLGRGYSSTDNSTLLSLLSESHPVAFVEIEPLERYPFPPLIKSVSAVSTKATVCGAFYKECMDICDKTHTRCHRKGVEQLPTRLLHLSPASSGTVSGVIYCVRLISTRDEGLKLPADTKYAALSYCWGNQVGLRLTESNYQSLSAAIPFDRLPATIQDAVSVTVDLGLQYLWVDALCIKQDSLEDWSYEAATMCDIYQGCSIAIAASGASDSSEGLFVVRDPLMQASCMLSDTMFAGSGLGLEGPYTKPWPLETRGWVVQEHVLPARSIKFGSYMSWECLELLVNEFGEEPDVWQFAQSQVSSLLLEPEETDPVDVTGIRKLWEEILYHYSSAKLSKESDRLAAIEGVSSAIRRRTGWKWVYGLWEPFILQELLWKLEGGGRGSTGFGLPSWTWASLRGSTRAFVFPYSEPWTDVAKYLGISTPTSKQLSPEIKLSGILCKIRERDGTKVRVEDWPGEVIIRATYDHEDDDQSWTDGEILLPIGVFDLGRNVHLHNPCLTGLIVVPRVGSLAFECLGKFEIHPDGGVKRFIQFLKGNDGEPPLRQTILLT